MNNWQLFKSISINRNLARLSVFLFFSLLLMQPATAVVEVRDFVVTSENRARKTPGECLQEEGGGRGEL